MKSLLFVLLLQMFSFSISAQSGNIKGNVYFKYNNYVGNRADAGAMITLISPVDTAFKQEATADLQGNYYFPDLTPGDYLVVITSRNTFQTPMNSFINLKMMHKVLSKYCDTSFLKGALYDSIQNKINEYFDYARSKKRINEMKLFKMEQSMTPMIKRYYAQLPKVITEKMGVSEPVFKVRFQQEKVNDKTINIVTDFGISGSIL